MWTAIIGAAAAIFKAVTAYIQRVREKTLVALGRSEQRGEDLQGRIDALQEANRLREEARATVERDHADGLPDDDGFKRKDD